MIAVFSFPASLGEMLLNKLDMNIGSVSDRLSNGFQVDWRLIVSSPSVHYFQQKLLDFSSSILSEAMTPLLPTYRSTAPHQPLVDHVLRSSHAVDKCLNS